MTLFLEDCFRTLTEDWRGFVILIGHHVKTLELELALINSGCIFILDQIYFTNRMVKFVISITTLILLGIVLTGSENSCHFPDHLIINILLSNVSDPEVVGNGKVKEFSYEVSSHLVRKREAVRRKKVKQVGCKMQRQYFLFSI